MKILMVSDVYFPRVNGVSTSIATFRRELEAQGHTVHLIAPDYGKVTDDERNIHRIPARSLVLDPEDRMLKTGAAWKHFKRFEAVGFDVVHIHTPFVAHYLAVRLARRLGIPAVETYHTFFEEYLYFYVPFLPKRFMRFLARRFSASQCNALHGLVVPSSAMLDKLRAYGVTTPAEIIPTGLEPESFEPGDGRAFCAKHGIGAERPVITYVGRAAFEKNIAFLLEVAARLKAEFPNLLLVVAGEGPALAALRRKGAALGLADNLLFTGYMDRRAELPNCYRAADVFVFASRTETQGLVLLEAMAQGVPVVALAEMGASDVLKEGHGVLIAPADVAGFAARVGYLLRKRYTAARLGHAGRDYAAGWSAGAQAERLAEFYRHVAARHAGALARSPLAGRACLSEEP